jgi:hypothetical protein
MTARAALSAFFLAGALTWPAAAATLSDGDTNLGRISAQALPQGLTIPVDLDGDIPLATYVIARFQNNRALMRTSDGSWLPWDAETSALAESGATLTGDTLIFRIVDWVPSGLFFPVSFTVAYRTASGLKSGTVVIDAP